MTKGHEVTGSAAAPSGVPKMAERPGRPETLPTVPAVAPGAAVRPSANGTKGKASGGKAPAHRHAAVSKPRTPKPPPVKPPDSKSRPATNGARKAKGHPAAGASKDGAAAAAKNPSRSGVKPAAVKAQPPQADAESGESGDRRDDLEIIERIVPETKPRGLLGISFGTIKLDRMDDKLFASPEDTLARERAAARKPVLSFLKRPEKPTAGRPAHAAKAPGAPRDARTPEQTEETASPPPDTHTPERAGPAAQTDHAGAADRLSGAVAYLGSLLRRVSTVPGDESGRENTAAAPSGKDAASGELAPPPNRVPLRDRLRTLTDRARSLIHRDDETEKTHDSIPQEPAAKPVLPATPAVEGVDPAEPVPAPALEPAGIKTAALPIAEAHDTDGAADSMRLRPPAAKEPVAPIDSASSPDAPIEVEPAAEAERANGRAAAETASPPNAEAESAKQAQVGVARPASKPEITAKPEPAFAQFRSLPAGPDRPMAFAENPSPDPPYWPGTITHEPDWHTRAEDVLSQAAELARELEAGPGAEPEPAVSGPAPDLHELAEAVPMQDTDAPAARADEPPPLPGAMGPRQMRLDLNAETLRALGETEPSVDEPVQSGEGFSGIDDDSEDAAEERPPPAALAPPPFPEAPAAEHIPPARRPARGFRPIERRSILFPDPDPLREADGAREARDSQRKSALAASRDEPALDPLTADSGGPHPIPDESITAPESGLPAGDNGKTDPPPTERPAARRQMLDRESEDTPLQNDTRVHGWLRSRATHSPPPADGSASDAPPDGAAHPIPSGSSATAFANEGEPPDLDLWRTGRPRSQEETNEVDGPETGKAGEVGEALPPAERQAEEYDEYGQAAAAADQWRIGDEKDGLIPEPTPRSGGHESAQFDDDNDDDHDEEESTPATEVVRELNVLSLPSGRPERAASVMRDIARTATEYYAVPEKWPSAVKLGSIGLVLGGALGLLIHKLIGISGLPLMFLIIITAQIVGGLGFYQGYTTPFTSGSNKTRSRLAKPRRRVKSETWERLDHAPRVSDDGYPDDPESFIRAFEEGRLPPPRPRASRKSGAAGASNKHANRKHSARGKSGRRKRH